MDIDIVLKIIVSLFIFFLIDKQYSNFGCSFFILRNNLKFFLFDLIIIFIYQFFENLWILLFEPG